MIKLMKSFTLLLGVMFVSACSMQAIADKILPKQVQAHAEGAVDAALRKDASFFSDLRSEKMSDENFETSLDKMLKNVSEGAEIRRDIIGVHGEAHYRLGVGANKTFDVVYEVQTEDGFTVITLWYGQTEDQNECCEFRRITINRFEESPVRRHLAAFVMIAKTVAGIVVLGLFLFAFFLIRRTRRKKLN